MCGFWPKKSYDRLKLAYFVSLAQLLHSILRKQFFCAMVRSQKMSKVNNIFDAIEAGIRAETLRQKTIANNVANLETPGYRRKDVKFTELLAKAMDSDGAIDLRDIKPEIYQPETTAVSSNGNDVSLELEVGEMVKNTLRHKAFIKVLQKKYQQIDMAIAVK
jgi:flagellar basal-body rod protein FlgB